MQHDAVLLGSVDSVTGRDLAGRRVSLMASGHAIHFEPREDGRWAFTTSVWTGQCWHPAAHLPNPLVGGPSFDLYPQTVSLEGDGETLRVAGASTARPLQEPVGGPAAGGQQEGPTVYPWEGTVRAVHGGRFIEFDVRVQLPRAIRLHHLPMPEPQVILWLYAYATMAERQANEWRRTILQHPTKSAWGVPGNDLPAVYLYDPVRQAEFILFFDFTVMNWMGDQSLARFRDLRCAPVLGGLHKERYGVGLWADHYHGDTLEAGEYRFRWYLYQQHRQETPDQWEALRVLIRELTPFLWRDGAEVSPASQPKWSSFAEAALTELRTEPRCWVETGGLKGHPAYVLGTPRHEGSEKGLELITQIDVLWPLLLYRRARPAPELTAYARELLDLLPHFYRYDLGYVSNNVGTPGRPETVDLWYYLENSLIKWAWAVRLLDLDAARALREGSEPVAPDSLRRCLREMFLQSFALAREFARNVDYLFPLFFRPGLCAPASSGSNYSAAGLYAYAALLAFRMTEDPAHLEEASRALRAMHRLPLDLLHHEPQQLAFGALAAAELARLLPGPSASGWLRLANDFLRAQLRMAYWYDDHSDPRRPVPLQGMFQACASILYPAFKENVESLLPWLPWIGDADDRSALCQILALQQRRNVAFFGPGAAPHIPCENLRTFELEDPTGSLGKEIYGAGEVLWMALMFDTFAELSDPALMVANLDLLDWEGPPPFRPASRFLLYNPTPTERQAELSVLPWPSAAGDKRTVPISLAPGEHRVVTIGGGESGSSVETLNPVTKARR